MFACTTMNGTAIATAVTDVCNTPSPAGPVPMPYPNTAMLMTANPSTTVKNVIVMGMPVLNEQSVIPMTNGDNAGVNLGVVSGMVMGPCTFKSGSQKVNFGGKPAVFMTCQTGHNGQNNPNAMGTVVAPSQSILDVK
jgi:hypothetical protein